MRCSLHLIIIKESILSEKLISEMVEGLEPLPIINENIDTEGFREY